MQPTLAVPVKVTLITVSITTQGEERIGVPVRDLMGDSDGVEIITGTATNLEGVCGVGTWVHVGWDRWIREAACVAVDRAGWSGQAEANAGNSIPVVVGVAILTYEDSIIDGNLLVRCAAFHWGCSSDGGKGKTSKYLGTHFGLD